MTTLAEHVLRSYEARKCWVCGALGACQHREYEVEAAYILAEYRRRVKPGKHKPAVVISMPKGRTGRPSC